MEMPWVSIPQLSASTMTVEVVSTCSGLMPQAARILAICSRTTSFGIHITSFSSTRKAKASSLFCFFCYNVTLDVSREHAFDN